MTKTTAWALGQMTAATTALAASEEPLATRLQRCWDDHVQHVWEKPCLSPELATDFRALWERYTAPGDDPRRTVIRTMADEERRVMASEIVSFTLAVALDLPN